MIVSQILSYRDARYLVFGFSKFSLSIVFKLFLFYID